MDQISLPFSNKKFGLGVTKKEIEAWNDAVANINNRLWIEGELKLLRKLSKMGYSTSYYINLNGTVGGLRDV